jgi:hypothetical protein
LASSLLTNCGITSLENELGSPKQSSHRSQVRKRDDSDCSVVQNAPANEKLCLNETTKKEKCFLCSQRASRRGNVTSVIRSDDLTNDTSIAATENSSSGRQCFITNQLQIGARDTLAQSMQCGRVVAWSKRALISNPFD